MIKVTAEDLLEIEEGIPVVYEDAYEEEKTGEDNYKEANQ